MRGEKLAYCLDLILQLVSLFTMLCNICIPINKFQSQLVIITDD